MNCPACGQRNPSTAKHCLHCNAQFEDEREGVFDVSGDSESSGKRIILLFTAVVIVVVGGSMFVFGFDTYDSKCVSSDAQAAELEKAGWERDQMAERRKNDEADRRAGRKARIGLQSGFWQCYRKKTGHVDGVTE